MSNYNVTLKSSDDLDGFYADMENDGGSGNVPQRAVTVVNRRPISRNTVYDLETAEAEELLNDSRVSAVSEILPEGAITIKPFWEQTGNFDKDVGASIQSTDVNWGLLRGTNQQQIAGWGADGTVSLTRTIECTASGQGVDVVIVDGFLQVDNAQLAENSDGTGNSRVTQENWGAFRNAVDGGVNFNYQYTTGTANLNNGFDNHGIHVGSTVLGQTQGWARDANIFNISPYGTVQQPGPNPNAAQGASGTTCYDYIREWHNQKVTTALAANQIPRPTIMNNSWGESGSPLVSEVTSVNFQGVVTNGPFTEAQLQAFGLIDLFTDENGDRRISFLAYNAAIEADVEDAINAGIIMVGAAGNESYFIDVPGGANYNNTLTFTFNGLGPFTEFYHRGSGATSAGTAICVGAMDALSVESKADFSNTGPRIDVWAPGVNITSSLAGTDSGDPLRPFTTVPDSLDNNFLLGKLSGTSMASPQVCGVLACWLEQNPRANQAEAIQFLQNQASRPNQLAAGGNGGFTDDSDLQGAGRGVLCFDFLRPSSVSPTAGNVMAYPGQRFGARPDNGMVLPRNNRITEGGPLQQFNAGDFSVSPVAAGNPTVAVQKEYHIDFSGGGDPPTQYTWSTSDNGATVTPNGGGFNGVLEDNNCLITFANDGQQTITATATRVGFEDLSTTITVNVGAAGTAFTLSSPDFNNGDPLPDNVGINVAGANFANINNPALSWTNLPAGTQTLRLLCVDTDPGIGGFTHWSVRNIPNTTLSIAAQSRDTASNWPAGVTIEDNDWVGSPEEGNFSCENGWGACAPPPGETHTYEFSLTAFAADGTQIGTASLEGTYTEA